MPTASLLLRPEPAVRIDGFAAGFEASGFTVSRKSLDEPKRDDMLVLWNRYPQRERVASRYERAGATVLIAENGYLGREWRGGLWYAISAGQHNGAGRWPDGSEARWNGWGVKLSPWRSGGNEIVVLGQRGFGHPSVRAPIGWERRAADDLRRKGHPVRVRPHPGERNRAKPLEEDLIDASCVVTWSSGAALKALVMGIPVFHGFPRWIGAGAAKWFRNDLGEPFRGDRLPMFRKLAWAMWRLDEIGRGEPFRCLLK